MMIMKDYREKIGLLEYVYVAIAILNHICMSVESIISPIMLAEHHMLVQISACCMYSQYNANLQ